MTRRDRYLLLALAVVVVAMGLLPVLGVSPDVLLAAPVFALVLPLLAGRYFGEDRLARLAARFSRPLRAPAVATPCQRLRSPGLVPRGGRLIASSLAVRPPPAAAPSQ